MDGWVEAVQKAMDKNDTNPLHMIGGILDVLRNQHANAEPGQTTMAQALLKAFQRQASIHLSNAENHRKHNCPEEDIAQLDACGRMMKAWAEVLEHYLPIWDFEQTDTRDAVQEGLRRLQQQSGEPSPNKPEPGGGENDFPPPPPRF